MIFFTADTHFCHGNIIHLSSRPFKDIYEMNKEMKGVKHESNKNA